MPRRRFKEILPSYAAPPKEGVPSPGPAESQADLDALIVKWVSSPGLQPPK
ncbi:hypothetical protein [Nitrobacter vulgaris]|uniref:hypothetical protein n=1 Tax=Nitrobacter vulgaris TaxID=29421 RepID=UPI001302033A|nr:hypothetical protein [Nitrobacter vulgaris]